MAITRSESLRISVLGPAAKRRRCTKTPPKYRRKTGPDPPIWLDLLPQEVCERIAVAVSGGKKTSDALHLAQTSPVQSSAVVNSLSHALSVCSDTMNMREWISIFTQDIREVYISPNSAKFPPHRTSILLSVPTLRVASIPDEPVLLRAMAKTPSLQELSVCFQKDGRRATSTLLLMRTLSALRLRKLELQCHVRQRSSCPLWRIEALEDSDYALARCCPNLSSLDTNNCDHCHDLFWKIWNTLPQISEVVIRRHPPLWVIPRLRRIPSVTIKGMGDLPFETLLSASMTNLNNSFHVVDAAKVATLSACKKMTRMSLLLEAGAERSLEEALRAMTSLDSLTLRWERRTDLRSNIKCEYFECSNGRLAVIGMPLYVEATADVTLAAVQQATSLTRLCLLNIRIRVGEVVAILKHVGSRLTHFGVSFNDQHESSVKRFKTIVETIIEYNRGLRTVTSGDRTLPDYLEIDVIQSNLNLTEKQSFQLEYGRNLLHGLLRKVRICVPLLDEQCLKSWVNEVQWIDGLELLPRS